jgi:hypothetical protein
MHGQRYLQVALFLIVVSGFCSVSAAAYRLGDSVVVTRNNPGEMELLAANELRSYIYQLTGTWAPLQNMKAYQRPNIVLRLGSGQEISKSGPDPEQNLALYKEYGEQIVHGRSGKAVLWAAYELIESWGVGFYLGGDALPPKDPDRMVEVVERSMEPSLQIRGNLPWFNFLNSPTTWNPQDYKTFFAQMARQKANFIGFHAYDHEPFGAYNITDDEAVKGMPLMTTISPHRWWSPPATSTDDFLFGTDMFFNRGEWGCEVGLVQGWGYQPGRAVRWQQQMMADALAYARKLGIRTCLGWEVTGNPEDPKNKNEFRQRLQHTLDTYPLDYFWMWQSEGRGTTGQDRAWAGSSDEERLIADAEIAEAFAYLGSDHDLSEATRITRYVLLAHRTLQELDPDVRLVVSGWGGDAHMKFSSLYPGLDKVVPEDVIFAALDNIDPRSQDHVSQAYGELKPERERWPIPWFESDAGHTRIDQTGPQTNVTAFEPLLRDIVEKGCQGALGIHWRTRNVEDVAGYLYRFGWNPELSAAQYIHEYAEDWYGEQAADRMAGIHLRLEAFGPQYVGARGTVECARRQFHWFWPGGNDPLVQHDRNLAGVMPDTSRFAELEAMRDDVMTESMHSAAEAHRSAAVQYHDLGQRIHWLVNRAKVGLQIHDEQAPLQSRLKQAEDLFEQGQVRLARNYATEILNEIQAYDFRSAMQALASTCRTRGELGMLATANARYGRFYASFIERIARILGRPLTDEHGYGGWKGKPVLNVFPVPGQVGVGQRVCFDAVLLAEEPPGEFVIELSDLDTHELRRLSLERLGGAYFRGVFVPAQAGGWSWQLVSADGYVPPVDALPLDHGVVVIGGSTK